LPDVLTDGGLNEQLAFAQTLLAAYGLPTGSVRADDLRRRIQMDKALREQIESGRSLLLIVPRVPLSQVTAALTDGLRRNEDLLGLGNRRLHKEPVNLSPWYHQQPLEYLAPGPERWLSETEWLAGKDADALFVAPSADIPAGARNRSAEDAWRDRKPGEALLSPQSWCVLFLTLLERRGQTLDANTFSLLAGARFASSDHPSSGYVPDACWNPRDRRAGLGGSGPGDASSDYGARAASEGN
jgi:hypothetical protein